MLEMGVTEIALQKEVVTGFSYCIEIITSVLITCSLSDGRLFIMPRPVPDGPYYKLENINKLIPSIGIMQKMLYVYNGAIHQQ